MYYLIIIGSIIVIIYYVIKMRASARNESRGPNEAENRDFMRDVFDNSNNRASRDKFNTDKTINGSDDEINHQYLLGDPYEDLEKLAALLDKGIITNEEFEAKKKDLLNRI